MDIKYKRKGDKVSVTVSSTELHRKPNKNKHRFGLGKITKNTKVIHQYTFPDFKSAFDYGNSLFNSEHKGKKL